MSIEVPPYIKLHDRTQASFDTDADAGWLDLIFFYNLDTEEPNVTSQGQQHPLLSKGQWDAVIDDSFVNHFSDTWPTILDAIAATTTDKPIVSIFIRSAGDTDALTIASTDDVQRLQGKDADTTTLPVTLTCNKTDVTFEQFSIGNDFYLNNNRCIVKDVLITTGGQLRIGSSACVAEGIRVTSNTIAPISLQASDNYS